MFNFSQTHKPEVDKLVQAPYDKMPQSGRELPKLSIGTEALYEKIPYTSKIKWVYDTSLPINLSLVQLVALSSCHLDNLLLDHFVVLPFSSVTSHFRTNLFLHFRYKTNLLFLFNDVILNLYQFVK